MFSGLGSNARKELEGTWGSTKVRQSCTGGGLDCSDGEGQAGQPQDGKVLSHTHVVVESEPGVCNVGSVAPVQQDSEVWRPFTYILTYMEK